MFLLFICKFDPNAPFPSRSRTIVRFHSAAVPDRGHPAVSVFSRLFPSAPSFAGNKKELRSVSGFLNPCLLSSFSLIGAGRKAARRPLPHARPVCQLESVDVSVVVVVVPLSSVVDVDTVTVDLLENEQAVTVNMTAVIRTMARTFFILHYLRRAGTARLFIYGRYFSTTQGGSKAVFFIFCAGSRARISIRTRFTKSFRDSLRFAEDRPRIREPAASVFCAEFFWFPA